MSRPSDFRGAFRQDAEARAVYSEAAGIGQIIPRAVAVPADADDVVALVQWAQREGIPLIPRASGSSMSGGAIGPGVIVDMSGLTATGRPDVERARIRCEAGAVRDAVDAAARAVGLRFPVDPSSGAFCTVGGMVSTNAAGARTLLHGATRPWVEALDCVFADGTRGEIRRGSPLPSDEPVRRFVSIADAVVAAERSSPSVHPGVRKESSGYGLFEYSRSGDLVDLIVGSEGTLAILVGIELRLIPVAGATASILGAFDSLESAVDAAATARRAGASACELLDRTFLDVARSGGATVPVPLETEAVLLAEVEGPSRDACTSLAAALGEEFQRAGATGVALALDPATEHRMWELRHAASPILSRLDPSLKSMQFIEDGCVPPDRLADYVRGVRRALADWKTRGVIFGHAGDGHVHVNAMVDFRVPDWRRRMDGLLAEVTELTSRLGGTLAGEHGDGRLRAPLLHHVWPAGTRDRFAAVKQAFDPRGLLNPGAKIAIAGTPPVEAVKYDSSLEPLPFAARTALATVERDRAYARPRLTLLAEAKQEQVE